MASGTISTPQYTQTTSVEVTVTLLDADQIALSNDGSTFGAWQPAANNGKVAHTLTSGDGLKTVSAKFRLQAAGVESSVVTAQTTLDTVAPTGTLLINKGAPVTASASVTLSVTATDPTTPVLVRFKNETGDYGPFEMVTPEKSWSLTPGVGTKTVTMQIQDAAGNTSISIASIWLAASGAAKWLILKTPDYDDTAQGVQTSYLREGAANSSDENDLLGSHGGAPSADAARSTENGVTRTFDGWFEYTDGVRTEVTRGARVEITGGSEHTFVAGDQTIDVAGKRTDNIGGEYRINVGGNSSGGGAGGTVQIYDSDPIFYMDFRKQSGTLAGKDATWRKTTRGHVAADSYMFGDTENFFAGYKFDATFGLTNNLFAGGKIDFTAAVSFAATASYALEVSGGLKYSFTKGLDFRNASDHDVKGDTVRLRVKAGHDAIARSWEKVLAGGLLGAGAAVAAAVAGGGSADADTEVDSQGRRTSQQIDNEMGAAASVFTVCLIASLIISIRERASPKRSRSELLLTNQGAGLSQNNALGQMESALGLGGGRATLRNANSTIDMRPNGVLLATGTAAAVGTSNMAAGMMALSNGTLYLRGNIVHIANAPPPPGGGPRGAHGRWRHPRSHGRAAAPRAWIRAGPASLHSDGSAAVSDLQHPQHLPDLRPTAHPAPARAPRPARRRPGGAGRNRDERDLSAPWTSRTTPLSVWAGPPRGSDRGATSSPWWSKARSRSRQAARRPRSRTRNNATSAEINTRAAITRRAPSTTPTLRPSRAGVKLS